MKKYENYANLLKSLKRAPSLDLDDDIVRVGIIGMFSLQFELGWKLLKTVLAYEGQPIAASGSPRDIIKAAYAVFDFLDEDPWLSMLRDRNTITHAYDEEKSHELVDAIINRYIPAFQQLQDGLLARYGTWLTSED